MNMELYLEFVAAVAVLVLIPGPLVALIVSNSVTYGSRSGLMTVFGAAGATLVQLSVVALGMAAAVQALGHWFGMVRAIGGAYVVWVGVQAFRAAAADLTRTAPQPRSGRGMLAEGFLVALFNPKALLFYAAFFPQFISPALPTGPQVAVLCTTLLVLGVMCDSSWAVLAGRLRHLLALHAAWRNRITGGMLVTVGVALTFAQIQ